MKEEDEKENDSSDKGFPQTLCDKRKVVVNVPPYVRAEVAFNPPKMLKRAIPKKPSFLHSGTFMSLETTTTGKILSLSGSA